MWGWSPPPRTVLCGDISEGVSPVDNCFTSGVPFKGARPSRVPSLGPCLALRPDLHPCPPGLCWARLYQEAECGQRDRPRPQASSCLGGGAARRATHGRPPACSPQPHPGGARGWQGRVKRREEALWQPDLAWESGKPSPGRPPALAPWKASGITSIVSPGRNEIGAGEGGGRSARAEGLFAGSGSCTVSQRPWPNGRCWL